MTGLPGAAMEVSAILIAALGLAWVLRRRAASLRHGVYLIALACAAVVPLLDAVLPSWAHRQMVFPAMLMEVVAALDDAGGALGEFNAGGVVETRAGAHGVPETAPDAGSDAATGTMAATREQPAGAAGRSVRDMALRIHLGGLAIALLIMAVGLARLAWITSRATPVESPAWHRQLARIARRLQVRHPVRLASSAEVHAPATCGVVRPMLLLPPAAEAWPEERIQAVLLHELAHVRRNDWAVQMLALLLRAVYWFNPLVWLTCARLRQEAERACDDVAVAQGMDPETYSSQLLALARLAPARGAVWLPATAMARPSMLRRRVAAILDTQTPRHSAGGGSLAGVAMLFLLVTVLAAACDVGGNASPGASAPVVPTAVPVEKPPAINSPLAVNSPEEPEADSRPPQVFQPTPPVQTGRSGQRLSPRAVVADILALVDSSLEDPALAALDEITYPITGLHHVQRHARDLLDSDGRDAAAQAARYTEIINALRNTGVLAANLESRPRGRGRAGPQIAALGATLQARSVELREALLPLPASPATKSTPLHRATVATLDTVQAALRTPSLTNARQQNWLVTELETLERVARFANAEDSHAHPGEPGSWHLLLGSLRSTARQAFDISRRAEAPGATRDGAAGLAGSLQELALRVENELRRPAAPQSLENRLAAMLVAVAAEEPGLALETIRRTGELTIATFGDGGPEPLTVLFEESASEVAAMQKEELSVLTTPTSGVVREVAGMRLHVWGSDAAEGGYRVLARIGTVVVNVSAPPRMSRHVMPVMEGIARHLRQPRSAAGDPPA